MKVKEFDIKQAEGVILLSDIRLDSKILPKGHILNKEDLLLLKIIGITKISGIELGIGDVSVNTALGIIAPKICGENLVYTSTNSTNCKIVAENDGVFICSDDRLHKFNRMSTNMILNIIQPYKSVKKGDVIAILEIFSPIVEQKLIDDVLFRLAGNEPLLSVEVQHKEKAAIIYTRIYNDEIETKHFTDVTTKLLKGFEGMDIEFSQEFDAKHNIDGVADTILDAMTRNDLVFIIPGTETNHRNDVIPAALDTIVDDFVDVGIPQYRAHDLIIAVKRNSKLIVVPYNYDTVDTTIIDRMIRTAITKDKIHQYDFSRPDKVLLTNPELSAEEKEALIVPENTRDENEAAVAAVILAAGISSRARRNKLMIDLNGKPLFMKSVEAAIKSNASPVFVVTGHKAEEVEEYLQDLDINVIRNYDYASGIKTSINLGLNSVPSFCDGAILIPADMPNIKPEYLNKMIKSIDKGKRRQLRIASYKGRKINPVLWGSDLFKVADLVPENADIRPVFLEHSDYTKLIETDKKSALDINFPNDIEEIKKVHK